MGNMSQGYIRLHRQLQDCWVWKGERFSRGQAWVDLLMMANHKDVKIPFGENIEVIERGQFITSIAKLSEKWMWSFNTTKKFLNLLENDNMLIRKSDNTKTLITIVNYDIYQYSEDEKQDSLDRPTDRPIDRPTDRVTDRQGVNPLTDSMTDPLIPNNNDNNELNDNNENNNIPPYIPPKGKEPKKQTAAELRKVFNSLVDESDLSDALKVKMYEWLDYKSQIKNQYKSPDGFSKLLTQVSKKALEFTDTEVIRVMDDTMAAGYKGIVWDWLNKKKQNTNTGSAYIDAIQNRLDVVDKWLKEGD